MSSAWVKAGTNLSVSSGVYPNFIDCNSTVRAEELRVYGYGLVVVGNSSTLMRISNNINNYSNLLNAYNPLLTNILLVEKNKKNLYINTQINIKYNNNL